MTSECCKELYELLEKNDGKEEVEEHDFSVLAKTIEQSHRQCDCLLQNPNLIMPLENMLKRFYSYIINYTETLISVTEWNLDLVITSERFYQAVGKTFQLQYPLYQAYESVKNNFEISKEKREIISKFCDTNDPAHSSELLFENVADFCDKGGFNVVLKCFENPQIAMPLNVAGHLISLVGQVRSWLNDDAIIKLIKPLATPVTNYLCNMSEDELRLMSARATAEVMINTVKVNDSEHPWFDIDILNIAFKYFVSTTLAIRMAGLNLITNQIHQLIEMGQNHVFGDIDNLCVQLATWLNEKEMVEHLFGPNYHVELIKQSQFLLNFLAQERQLMPKHLDCIWAAAQLKHISRFVLDLLITLAKTMDLVSVQYLLKQISKITISSHTKQTLLLSSLLTRNIWTAGLAGSTPDKAVAKMSPKKLSFPSKPIPFKQLHVSPIQSPSLSSEASTDEEVADIHARRFAGTHVEQIEQLRSLDLKINESQIQALTKAPFLRISPSPPDIESCLLGSQGSAIIAEVDDAISCTNTNGSSLSDREKDIADDLDDESSLTSAVHTPVKHNVGSLPIDFDVEKICEPGTTLLWDIIQNQSLESELVLDEAQKLLWQLICYSGDAKVRMAFIKGCVDNIKSNRSVIVSFKILPKILSLFPHSNNSSGSSKLLKWAIKELDLMECFFDNLKDFSSSCLQSKSTNGGDIIAEREQQIQARLDFITALFSNEMTPDHFRLSINQVNCLWSCLVTNLPDSYHFLILSWLLKQTNSDELHALGLDSFKHIFINKIPELNAEKMTLTGLNLFQKLFGLTRLSNASPINQQSESQSEEFLLGMEQLWKIAFKAERLHVANEAMKILTHLYLAVGDSAVEKIEEFIQKCMTVLKEAIDNLEKLLLLLMEATDLNGRLSPDMLLIANRLHSLKMFQQVLKILCFLIETFSKRYCFHLELWRLNGKNITSHQTVVKSSGKDHLLRILCQPTGVTEKITFKMLSSDYLAKFRARVTHWGINAQKEKEESTSKSSMSGPVLKPPFRLITHGHELTPDLDMKTMGELGVKNQQLVYISMANIRKDRITLSQLPPSLQPAPNFEALPMIQLLNEENFRQLFNLLEILYKVSKSEEYQRLWMEAQENKHELSSVHEVIDASFDDPNELVKPLSAEQLICKTWELILMLPTNSSIKNKFVQLDFNEDMEWESILNLEHKFKLLYVLQILDVISVPKVNKRHGDKFLESSSDSDSSLSDTDKEYSLIQNEFTKAWINKLFENGFVGHLLHLIKCEQLNPQNGLDEWSINCLSYIVKLLTRIGLVDMLGNTEGMALEKSSVTRKRCVFRARYKSSEMENTVVINQLNQPLLDLLSEDNLFDRLILILQYASESSGGSNISVSMQDVRASVIYHALSFLVCWLSSDEKLCEALINHPQFTSILIRLVFFSPLRSVRIEASRGFYKLCVSGGPDILDKVLGQLLSKLEELVSLQYQSQDITRTPKEGEKIQLVPPPSNYKDYFWVLCRLINKYNPKTAKEKINIRVAILQVCKFIQSKEKYSDPSGLPFVDYCLIGLLHTCASLLHHDLEFKNSTESFSLMKNIFHQCLFCLPNTLQSNDKSERPKCETKIARQAAYDLLLQLVSGCREMYLEVQNLFLKHHSINEKTKAHSFYGWNYWPHEQERSPVGYVGLVNLGATCYMASCVQQLFMIPIARKAILEAPLSRDNKHHPILKEVQKMFANLQCSLRKAYNPRSFCKTYTMDKQPLNTGEQRDMTEFFTDFVSKLEEMGLGLKQTMRELFCGVITNNVISLDCSHVSKTEEEFYSVRCTVADMKTLYESLDEVTVKDVLEGDNKYTCSQCNSKVRAEKRACFKTLPKVMCFNTMRYTFNMVTMMKEKVNTHFSFPMKLNMAGYTEECLLNNKDIGDAEDQGKHWYNLAGVVVHTGTADGGHYYSFIRDRMAKDIWYLFNDAEVKIFDPSQIAAECFGGEMTTKTFDAMTEKYMDFSFEKTHSAYMLFYEHADMDRESYESFQIQLPQELKTSIWADNYQFFLDKLIFDPSYINFMWQFCSSVPKSISSDVLFHSTKLATSFLLETLVHSREKVHMKGWLELIVYGFEHSSSACEWFLDNMASDDWWPQQLFIKCPTQHIRQLFGQLCMVAVKTLRPTQVHLYHKETEDDNEEDDKDIGSCSPITRFIKSVLSLLQENLKVFCKHLADMFHFLYQFLSLGHEECAFLLKLDAITVAVKFYNNLKSSDNLDNSSCDEDEEIDVEDDEILSMFPEDKFHPGALEKMISCVALLLEEARDGEKLRLSELDKQCLIGNQDFPFLYQITHDAINLRQTAHVIFHLSCYNLDLAKAIVSMLLSAAQKLPVEQCQPFFKLITFLIDVAENGIPGLPSFMGIILPKLWKTVDCNPALCLDWLATQVPRNSQIHQFVLQNLDQWAEKYLIADSSPRIRGGAAFLLISLVPNQHFSIAYRGRMFSAPHKELKMNTEAKSILHQIYMFLLNLLRSLKKYCGKNHAGTTRLVNYFTVLSYCTVSDDEKAMFTPFSEDLWKLYHPTMSEPDISVHINKQALLSFWYHVCDNFDDNIKFITDTEDVSSNIAYNYILSNDDQDVIQYNNATLPIYYGLLRLACTYSKDFCQMLACHPNINWAFEHLMPRANHYPQAVDELLHLMKLFAGEGYSNSEEDLTHALNFRRKAIELFCGCMDGQHSWTILVTILKHLIESEEDCVYVACHNGLNPLGEAFSTLHMMSHEATACNVTSDIIEVSALLRTILDFCNTLSNKIPEAHKALSGWLERTDIMLKALSMLNSFVPREVHKACLELLSILLQIYPEECIETIATTIHQSHLSIRMTQNPLPVGPYFPKPSSGSLSQIKRGNRKMSSNRGNGHELNMTLHPSLVDSAKGQDKNYEMQLADYFEGYHTFVDKMCRYGLNLDQVPYIIIEISCMLAVEVLPLKFNLFPKLWQEVWQKSSDNPKYRKCIQRLFLSESFIEFIDTLFQDERELFENSTFYSFACFFLPKVHQKILLDQKENVLNMIFTSLVADATSLEDTSDETFEKICPRINGDLRALCLLLSVTSPDEIRIPNIIEGCVATILQRYERYKASFQQDTNSTSKSDEKLANKEDEAGPSSLPEEVDEKEKKDNDSDSEPPSKRQKSDNEELDEKEKSVEDEEQKPGPSRQFDKVNDSNDHKELEEAIGKQLTEDLESNSSLSSTELLSDNDETSAVSSDEDDNPKMPGNYSGKRKIEIVKPTPKKADILRKSCESLMNLISRRKKGPDDENT